MDKQEVIKTFLSTSLSKGLFTVSDMLDAIRPVLADHGLIVVVKEADTCEGGVCSPLPAWIQQVRAEREAAERQNNLQLVIREVEKEEEPWYVSAKRQEERIEAVRLLEKRRIERENARKDEIVVPASMVVNAKRD